MSEPPPSQGNAPERSNASTRTTSSIGQTTEGLCRASNGGALELEHRKNSTDLLRHMHDVAGKYHLHYSAVRTTATSLVLPIGLLASITLLTNCTNGIRIPMRFLIFIIITTLFLNMLFARWSRACRHLERYYEEEIGRNASFNQNKHGFRHLFRQKIRKIPPSQIHAVSDSLGRLSPFTLKTWLDPFVWAILIMGVVFLWLYDQMFHYACGGISFGEKVWSYILHS
jgi:hypothetical protein